MLSFNGGGLAVFGLFITQLMPPYIFFMPCNIIVAALDHQDMFKAYAPFLGGCIYAVFKIKDFATAITTIGSNHQLCPCIFNAILKGLGGKATKDHRVRCTNPCACQHGKCSFRNHRHINHYAVTFVDTQLF